MKLPKLVQDAAYVSLGFGVLAFQKAQVRRRQLERLLADRCGCGEKPAPRAAP
ncbi:MAG TPA: hypothetical protein VK975_07490 [Acidimicrobiales bacterium]|nr:hypothetical protein [Acidimicrobiales bacterium]